MPTIRKIIDRVTETKWSKLYITVAVLQCIFIVTIQLIICTQNTVQASMLPQSTGGEFSTASSSTTIAEQASDRLGRIKWENIAFVGFQVWFVGMVFDATIYQNTAEILALSVMNVICSILAALEVVDGNKWLTLLQNTTYDTFPLNMAKKLEISLSVVVLGFALVLAYLSYQMSRQFGWNIYKKIGADIQIQRMYRLFQFFVLSLKVDIFTGFLVSIFYLIQFALKQGIMWESGIQLVVTILMLPMLYFARTAGSTESIGRMVTFLTFECIVLVHYVLILTQTLEPGNYWYTWIVLVFVGIATDVITIGLGVMCMRNFDKGLQPFVQRGRNKHKLQDLEMQQKNQSRHSWRIDDD
ncbi:hypothetical protein DM01DRAFT_1407075 [Hesseltinella vesiculosa]|uniref:TRP C-terminal domain-containing protein n=1 Tax=Hesseltinella vesiculosa TaxID=101127 RepID=A0A1X2GJ58_9FUNG|nr:hypothetical protein DM01DRAFT_1407075 [Hesseltinella vesiculosa]